MKRILLSLLFLGMILTLIAPVSRSQESDEGDTDSPQDSSTFNRASTGPADDPFFERFSGASPELAQRLEPIYFRREKVFGFDVIVPNATVDIERGLNELERSMPKAPLVPLYLSKVLVALGKIDEAKAAMERHVRLSGRSAESLGMYADFLDSRLAFKDEVRVLNERAELLSRGGDDDKQKAKSDYLRIIRLIENARLSDFDPFDYYRKIVAMLPNDSATALEYVHALDNAGKIDEALKQAEIFTGRFPNQKRDWFAARAELYKKAGRNDEAIALYETLNPLDATEPYNDYFVLLSDLGKIGAYTRKLEQARATPDPADAKTMAAWFRLKLWNGNDDAAQKGMKDWVNKLSAAGKLQGNLSLIGKLLFESTSAESAAPYFYTQYVVANDAASKEEALWGLFRSLNITDENLSVFSSGVAPGIDLFHLDGMPSVSGGVFSLLLNGADMTSRASDLAVASAAYRNNRMAARVADETRRVFPNSSRLPEMDWGLVNAAVTYQDWAAVEVFAVNFAKSYPKNGHYFDALFTLADSYAKREKFAEEGQTYRRILDEAARAADASTYQKAFDAYVASLTNQERFLDVLSLYWDEIGKHPDNENLYEAFLKFAGEHNLYDQELKLYQRAIARFNEPSWYQRMARWYLKNKGQAEFARITGEIRSKLDDTSLGNYLGEFGAPDWNNIGDAKTKFYLESYLYAHKRFTHNLDFVRTLVRYYANFNSRNGAYATELESLRVEYFIFDEDIRAQLMRSWMGRDKLAGYIVLLDEKANRNTAETFLLAWGKRWLGDHEGVVAPLGTLIGYYPGSPSLVSEGAMLDRSLAHSFNGDDPKRLDSAVERYRHLAALYPRDTQYITQAGEVLAERGEMAEARKLWRGIIDVGPGMPSVYKELASLLWDYYQFDEAASVLEKIRKIRNDPYLFTIELAAVYESKGDYNSAVSEYVKQHAAKRFGAEQSLGRLEYLTSAHSLGPKIEDAYRARIAAAPDNPTPLLAYVDYLKRIDRGKEVADLLGGAMGRYHSREFIEECVTAFAGVGRYDLEEKALVQLLDINGGQYEDYARLAAFHESRKNWPKAEDTYLKLVASVQGGDNEIMINALNDFASYYWRRERFDDALKRYAEAASLAEGDKSEELRLALARRYINRNKLDEAATLLLKLIDAHPTNTTYFNTLAEVYQNKNDIQALAALYKTGIENLKKANISREDRKAGYANLRSGLAWADAKLGLYTEALDQYIEVINLYPLDEYRLDQVYRFAEEHKLVDRLRAYYAKTAESANKNFRWQLVLARIDMRRGDLESARNEYRAAIKLEPQFDWLYSALADLSLMDGKYSDVIAVYESLAELSPDPSTWNIKIATAMFEAGRRDDAIARGKKVISGNPPSFKPYFEVADLFLKWNAIPQAEEALHDGIARFNADIYRDSMTEDDARIIVMIMVRVKGFESAFGELQNLRDTLLAEINKKENFRREKAKASLNAVNAGLSTIMAKALRSYGVAADQRQIAKLYSNWAQGENVNDARFDVALGFAREAGLPDLERDLYDGWLARHAGEYNVKETRGGYVAVEARYSQFLFARRDYAGIEKFILSRPERSRYNLLLARTYRITGRTEDEIAILRGYIARIIGPAPGGFGSDDVVVSRYIELLISSGHEQELRDLASSPKPLTGYYLNEFIARGRKDLALATIANGCNPKGDVWLKAKSALVYLYFKDTSGPARGLFTSILGAEPIGPLMNRQGDGVLMDRTWTNFAWHYGEFLDLAKDNNYDRWLAAVPEDSPRSFASYLQVGDYQLDKKRNDIALAQYNLAAELDPKSIDVISDQGRALYMLGKKKEAFAALDKLLNPKSPGSYVGYRDIMSELGEDARGNDTLAAYLVKVRGSAIGGYDEALQSLLDAWKDDPARKESFLKQLVAASPNDMALPNTVIDSRWLEGAALDFFFETLIGIIESESPVNTPLRDDWRRQYMAHLVLADEPDKAIAFINENERLEIINATEAALTRGEVYLRSNSMDRARIEFRKALGPEPISSERFEPIITILNATEFKDEQRRWLEESLNLRLKNGSVDQQDYSQLAEIYFIRGDSTGAVKLLERMVRLKAENPEGLGIAAELATKYQAYGEALGWRQRLLPLAPDDDSNRFEIAWLTGKTGNLRSAFDQSMLLIDDPSVTNRVRFEIANRLPALIEKDSALLASGISMVGDKVKAKPRESEYLLLANLYLKSGNKARFVATLQDAIKTLPTAALCSLTLAQFYAANGDFDQASQFYRKVIYVNPNLPSVFVELVDVEMKRGKARLAMDALPVAVNQNDLNSSFNENDTYQISTAVAGVWSQIPDQARFVIRVSETAEQLGWLDAAIAFASSAKRIVQNTATDGEGGSVMPVSARPGVFGKWFGKTPEPPGGSELLKQIDERIHILEEKRDAAAVKKANTLRITANLEDQP